MVVEDLHTVPEAVRLRLQALQDLFAPHESLAGLLEHAAGLAAEWFESPGSIIVLLAEDGVTVRLQAEWQRQPGTMRRRDDGRDPNAHARENGAAGTAASSASLAEQLPQRHEVRMNGRVLGYLFLDSPTKTTAPGGAEQEFIATFCVYLGRAIEMMQMRQTLASTYARVALRKRTKQEKEQQNSLPAQVLSSVQNPEAVAKIIARSFYRDLRKAGFETKQVLVVASELIRKLNDTLNKTQAKTEEW